MCEHDNREEAMTVVAPGVGCDPCIAPLVKALNDAGLPTVTSCCGHNYHQPSIGLADGRWVVVMSADEWDAHARRQHDERGCKPGRECSTCATTRVFPPGQTREEKP